MSLRLIIDGYNLMHAYANAGATMEREELVEKLAVYKRAKQARVSVVFDGRSAITLGGSTQKHKGVEIVFAPRNSDADSVIRNISASGGKGLIVVTSDFTLGRTCERSGAVVVGASEFLRLLDEAEYAGLKGLLDNDEDDPLPDACGRKAGSKKGQARKLSKTDRERAKKLKKM